ncbi:MAG: hypothetical protein HQL47_09435, partial [Gammaproteobacteria bacterium]|nr:hypothetical protein [Gammaproteobacteria bacterium]
GPQGQGEAESLSYGLGLLQAVTGNTAASTTSATLGGQISEGLIHKLNKTLTHAGLALAVAQTLYDFTYNFSDDQAKLRTFANLAKNVASNLVSYFGSAALQVGFAGVFVFDQLLATVQSDMVELKLENIGKVYEYYNEVEVPRSNREWRSLFIRLLQEHKDDPAAAYRLMAEEIDSYCNRFWTLGYEKHKELAGVAGLKWMFDPRDYTKDKEQINQTYREHLMYRLQAPLKSAQNFVLVQAQEVAQQQLEQELRRFQQEMNQQIKLKILDLPLGDGKFRYTGHRIRLSRLSAEANPEQWTGIMPERGDLQANTTLLGYLQSGAPNQVEVYAPGSDSPHLVKSFVLSAPLTEIPLGEAAPAGEAPAAGFSRSFTTDFYNKDLMLDLNLDIQVNQPFTLINEGRQGDIHFYQLKFADNVWKDIVVDAQLSLSPPRFADPASNPGRSLEYRQRHWSYQGKEIASDRLQMQVSRRQAEQRSSAAYELVVDSINPEGERHWGGGGALIHIQLIHPVIEQWRAPE